jgi:hypothetical protein
MKVVAGFAFSNSLRLARMNSPTLLRVGFPYIRPIQNGTTTVPTDPNMMVLHFNQLDFPTGEPIGVDASTTGTTDPIVVLLWFVTLKPTHLPHGDGFWMRYTTTAADTTAIQPFRWSQLTPTFDQTLPSGTYVVVGFEHTGPSAVGARLIFPGSNHRPGTVASPLVGNRTYQGFYDGSFGAYGAFRTTSPPYVEVLASANDATGSHEGYMRLVRVGDLHAHHAHDPHRSHAPALTPGQVGAHPAAPTREGMAAQLSYAGRVRSVE